MFFAKDAFFQSLRCGGDGVPFSRNKKTEQNRYCKNAEAADNNTQTAMPSEKELHKADIPKAGKPNKASRRRELLTQRGRRRER
ncbi:MAG: hypothetical protein RSE36_07705 [Oscillospiraceae bacterium]